jgi:hypothetical protein
MAHVCAKPAATAETPLVKPVTSIGVTLQAKSPHLSDEGAPSCSEEFAPQHFTPPACVSAQVWL